MEVPRLLRAGGIKLVTLAEHYGRPADESVEDPTWITNASAQGWVLFMKDARIKRRPVEKQAILESRARCFCLSDGNLPFAVMAEPGATVECDLAEACGFGPRGAHCRTSEIATNDPSRPDSFAGTGPQGRVIQLCITHSCISNRHELTRPIEDRGRHWPS